MLKLKNMGPIAFRKYILDKDVYIFGAGRAMESCLYIYLQNKDVKAIVDNNSSVQGNVVQHRGQEITILSKNSFIDMVKENKDNAIILVSSTVYAAEIVEDLDRYDELNGIECFLQVLIRNTSEGYHDFSFTQGVQKIPKKIHYIWVGGKPLPKEYEKNIETWKKFNPDYEIIRWDESNYDFNKCEYIAQAYKSENWSFATNYARLDIVYENGGIYLDTDVEVCKNFDCLLNDDIFLNMGCEDRINMGCGFGSVPEYVLIKNILNKFESDKNIIVNGKFNRRPFSSYVSPVVMEYGLEMKNMYQNVNGVVIYPSEIMSPLTIYGMRNNITNKTLSIHKENGTWKTDGEKKTMFKLNEIIRDRVIL